MGLYNMLNMDEVSTCYAYFRAAMRAAVGYQQASRHLVKPAGRHKDRKQIDR